MDRDPQAILVAEELAVDRRLTVKHGAFSGLAAAVAEWGCGAVDGVLFDLGVSSPQLDEGGRGFSFRFDAPLDMRMDTTQGETVAEWLAQADVVVDDVQDAVVGGVCGFDPDIPAADDGVVGDDVELVAGVG